MMMMSNSLCISCPSLAFLSHPWYPCAWLPPLPLWGLSTNVTASWPFYPEVPSHPFHCLSPYPASFLHSTHGFLMVYYVANMSRRYTVYHT